MEMKGVKGGSKNLLITDELSSNVIMVMELGSNYLKGCWKVTIAGARWSFMAARLSSSSPSAQQVKNKAKKKLTREHNLPIYDEALDAIHVFG